MKKIILSLLVFNLCFNSANVFAQNILHTTDIKFEKIVLYGCGNEVVVKYSETEFDFGKCKILDSIRVVGQDNLFFKEYKWTLDDEQLFINIALSYVNLDNSYSLIFHNENSVVWHIYENNRIDGWANLIVPNCDGDNTHKTITDEKLAPILHVPDEYLHH